MTRLETDRLLLREITFDDAADMYEYAKNPNVGPRAGWTPHKDISETQMIISTLFSNKEWQWGIVMKDTGRLIGSIGVVPDPKREHNPNAFMLGYAMGEEYWGRGIMTEAARAVTEYVFSFDFVLLISAYCFPYNIGSRRIMEKIGMTYEATQRQSYKTPDGDYLDEHMFSISKEEWMKNKSR